MPPPARLLLVVIHVRTNPTHGLAALFRTSQSTVDRIIHYLIPVLADALRPTTDDSARHHADPGARPVDHRDQQELPPQRQLPDHHLRSSATCDRRRPVQAR
jgi:hypothetical protein